MLCPIRTKITAKKVQIRNVMLIWSEKRHNAAATPTVVLMSAIIPINLSIGVLR